MLLKPLRFDLQDKPEEEQTKIFSDLDPLSVFHTMPEDCIFVVVMVGKDKAALVLQEKASAPVTKMEEYEFLGSIVGLAKDKEVNYLGRIVW